MGALTAVHLTAHNLLSILDGNAALGIAHKHDEADHRQEQSQDQNHDHGVPDTLRGASLAGNGGLQTGIPEVSPQEVSANGDAGQNTGEQQHRDTVADALFVDLLAQPHHQRRTGGKAENDNDSSEPATKTGLVSGVGQGAELVTHHKVVRDTQHQAQNHGAVTSVLAQLLAAGLTLFGQALQSRNRHRQQLNNDAGVDVGGDGQRKQRSVGEAAAGHHGQIAHEIVGAGLHLAGQIRSVHEGHGDGRTNAENQQDEHGEEDLLTQVRDLPRIAQNLEHNQITSAFPPAASILALADSEKAATWTVSFFSILPLPRILTP